MSDVDVNFQEDKARAKARRDWQDLGQRDNNYPSGIQRVAYDAEFMKVSGMFNENGAQYE